MALKLDTWWESSSVVVVMMEREQAARDGKLALTDDCGNTAGHG
jgi:hypothetical protein